MSVAEDHRHELRRNKGSGAVSQELCHRKTLRVPAGKEGHEQERLRSASRSTPASSFDDAVTRASIEHGRCPRAWSTPSRVAHRRRCDEQPEWITPVAGAFFFVSID